MTVQLTLTIDRIEFHDTYQVSGTLADGSQLFIEAKKHYQRQALAAILPEFHEPLLQQMANKAFRDANPPESDDPDRAYMPNAGLACITLDVSDDVVAQLQKLNPLVTPSR